MEVNQRVASKGGPVTTIGERRGRRATDARETAGGDHCEIYAEM